MPKSTAEAKFARLWDELGGPRLESEVRFHPVRRWRFDFAHPESKTAIEIEGGVWTGGRHTSGAGFTRDCEKYNAALVEGWEVFRLTTSMITPDNLQPIIDYIKRKI